LDISVSKIEAANSQLKTAIILYFNNGDPVSTHTLSAAGFNVLNDINNKSTEDYSTLRELFLDSLINKAKDTKSVITKIRAPENFFKHADNDPEGLLSFASSQTAYLIFDAVILYSNITKSSNPFFTLFTYWMAWDNPEMFDLPEVLKSSFDQSITKQEFYEQFLPIVKSTFDQ